MDTSGAASRRIGKYEILEEIGRGGFAVVYKALDTQLERVVALKVLAPFLLQDPVFLRRFHQEARQAAKLNHPNIVTIFDLGEFEGNPYIAMEYLEGDPLDRLIARRGRLPPQELAQLAAQVAAGLDHAHAHGLVHRDVKPGNIVVRPDGRAVLTDFGLVKALDGTQLTTTGASLGTPEYMSPEQAELELGQPLDKRSDIYSLGVVLYQACTGSVPFSGESPSTILYKHVHQPPPPPRTFNSEIPPALENVLLKALAKRPDDRYQSAGALAQALAAAVANAVPPVRPIPPPPPDPKITTTPDTPVTPARASKRRAPLVVFAELLGWIGFLGVGWYAAGFKTIGRNLLIIWLLVCIGILVLGAGSFGLVCFLGAPVFFLAPIISAVLLGIRLAKE